MRCWMVRWHNVKILALPPGMGREYYASGPAWGSGSESIRVLSLPTPHVFANYSNIILIRERSDGLIWCIAVAEFAFLALLWFLGALQVATVALPCADNRIVLSGCGLLVPFPVPMRKPIEDLEFLRVVERTQLDTVMLYVTSTPATKVDWSCLDLLDQFHRYRFEGTELYALPEGSTMLT